jgi:hypothetical protein
MIIFFGNKRGDKMSLEHDFKIITDNCYDKDVSTGDMISISDDLIRYIRDSLLWIKTLWNGKRETNGLNYYGYTIIVVESIQKLERIISAWILLFENSGDTILLTGDYLIDNDKYETIEFTREECLTQLRALKKMCEKAAIENRAILHEGI